MVACVCDIQTWQAHFYLSAYALLTEKFILGCTFHADFVGLCFPDLNKGITDLSHIKGKE